jgi:DNA-binding Xre family transcriptional regulator
MLRRKKRGTLKPNASSVVLNIVPVLTIRNIKTPFTYLTKLGICPASVSKMLSGKAVQINFKQLTSLCLHLNCTPNDLFAIREMSLPPQHQLNHLEIYNEVELPNIDESWKWKSMEEVKSLLAE